MAQSTDDPAWHPADHLDAVGVSEPQWWLRALELTATRLHNGPSPGVIGRDQQVDARFFVLALERFRTTLECIAIPQLPPELQRSARAQLAAFHRVARRGAITDARDILMHSEAYLAGTGKVQNEVRKRQPTVSTGELSSRYVTGIGYYPDNDAVRVGKQGRSTTIVFQVAATVEAAQRLYSIVYRLLCSLPDAPSQAKDESEQTDSTNRE